MAQLEQSILKSTKKILGLAEDYDVFDLDVITHINTAFGTLQDLGVGPVDGFMIDGYEATWETFLGTDMRLNAVRTYVFLKTRLAFDPPATSFHINAIKEQIAELEWRLNVAVDTSVPTIEIDANDVILDGGGA